MTDATRRAFDFLSTRNPLNDLDVDQARYVCWLMDYVKVQGEEALQALAGSYLWAVDNLGHAPKKQDRFIRSTFAHDLGGMNERFMLPRSSEYLEVWQKEYNTWYTKHTEEVN